MKCKNCGHTMFKGDTFCHVCQSIPKTITSKEYRKTVKQKVSKEKMLLESYLKEKCINNGLPFETEYKFDKIRKWKFDYAIPELKTAAEYEGIFSQKSRHTTMAGFIGDIEKYNHAALQGWKLYRFAASDFTKSNIEKTYKFIDQIFFDKFK